jgi:hypothetical protein
VVAVIRQAVDVADRVVVRGSSALMGLPVLVFGLIFASMPVGSGAVRGAWLLAVTVAFGLLLIRIGRMAITADEHGVVVRNLGRDYRFAWEEVGAIELAKSNNVSGAVSCLEVARCDGSAVVARAASSYSRSKVEEWRADLLAQRPGAASAT